MVKVRGIEINNKFFYWMLFVNIILFLITILQLNSHYDMSVIWYLFVYPFWIGFFTVLIAFHFYILNRGWFLYTPAFFLNYLLSYYMTFHHILITSLEEFEVTLTVYSTLFVIILIAFIFGLLIGGILGFLISLFLTVPDRPQKYKIKKNIISFEIKSKDEKEKDTIIELIGKYVRRDLKYYIFRDIDKYTSVYRENKLSTLKFILVSANNNKISFLPFIKDGFKYILNPDTILSIRTIGCNIFGLREISDYLITEKFIEYTNPHKILTLIKSIKDKRLSKDEKICLLILAIFGIAMVFIFVIPSYELEYTLDLSIINIVVTVIGIVVGIILTTSSIVLYRRFKKKK